MAVDGVRVKYSLVIDYNEKWVSNQGIDYLTDWLQTKMQMFLGGDPVTSRGTVKKLKVLK